MMLPNLSALAVRERAVTLFFLIVSVIAGTYAFLSLGRAEDPAFTVRAMVVSAIWPGASAEQVQNQVVDRLEKSIQEVEYLHHIKTTIRPNRADLLIEFQDFTPGELIPKLFQDVRNRVMEQAPNLPEGVIGPLINDAFGDVYFSLFSLTAPGLSQRQLAQQAEAIRDRLQRVEGVQKAHILGERPERYLLEFDTAQLLNLGISPLDIFDAIEANNRLVPAGRTETAGPLLYLRTEADLSDPDVLNSLTIRVAGKVRRLADLATLRQGYEEPATYLVRAAGQEALLLGVVMTKGENGLQLGDRLTAFLAEEQARMPVGMQLIQLTNQAEAIADAVNLFQLKFLIAVLVVLLVSMVAIGLRAGLVVGVAIPLTLGLTFMVMKLMGINLDRITLGALIVSLGLLVDDAIIAIEMMLVKMEQGWARVQAAAHAWQATAAPMLFGTLITVAGFVPIGFARSGVGEYAGNIFWVLAIALLVSWIVAVTFTPYLGVKLLPAVQAKPDHADVYRSPAYQRLRTLVLRCIRYRKTVVGITFVLLGLSVAGMVGPVQQQFFPGSNRSEVLISVNLPQGTAISVTDASVRKVEKLLADIPGIRNFSTYVGAGAPRFFLSVPPEQPDPAFGKLLVVTESPVARDAVMATLRQHVADGAFPEARIRVKRLLFGPPVDWPIDFRVLGPDPDVLRDIGHRVRAIMAGHPNVDVAQLEWDERVPVARLEFDPNRLAQIGLTPLGVAQQLQYQLDGIPVTQLRRGNRLVELRVRGWRPAPGSAEQATHEILTKDGRKVPFDQVGHFVIEYEEPVIKRYNRERYVSVRADVLGAQPNDVTADLWAELGDLRNSLPPGYHIDIGGAVEASGKAGRSIQVLQPLMVLLMLMFVMLQMRSFGGTFMVVATAPLGMIGAVAALLLFNQPFGFVAMLGLIGLAGILMRNTLILTQQVADNQAAGMAPVDAVVEAAVQRSRPVVLTALAAVLAFVPLTLDSFWGPLAYVLIGGVSVGTAITLLFVPALYALWFRLGRG